MRHKLKIHPEYFEALKDGSKTFEIRREDDRYFDAGDFLDLREYDPNEKTYTGRWFIALVTYLLRDPKYVKEGYVIMSIRRLPSDVEKL